MIISRTPFRISFFGGGTDYPAWYRQHGGAVLATTINKYCYITSRYLPPFFEHRYRIVYSRTERVTRIEEITHPTVREVLRRLKIERGVEIHHDGDLPARSGLGSSSAFTVGLLNAMWALLRRMVTKDELAREGIYIEQDLLKEAVGSQDQVLAAYGGFNHITFARSGDISVRAVILPAERIAELTSHLMLVFTGISRTASEVAETYVNDMAKNEAALRAIGEMVNEALAILQSSSREIVEFGQLLHEGWMLKRSLSDGVSNAEVEEIYCEARSAGAVGGKLVGAGGGGFMLLFAPRERRRAIRERLNGLVHVPFRFEHSGSQIIFFDPEEDYCEPEYETEWQRVRFRDRSALGIRLGSR